MEVLVRQAGQLRQVLADELPVRIELFRLRDRVEDPEVGLRIAARGGRPLPAAVVGCEVEIVELVGEILLAAPPVHTQILDQEACRHHPQPVVHIAALADLAHRRVHQRIAGGGVAPCLEVALAGLWGDPAQVVVLGVERLAFGHARVVMQDHEVEVAPDQFR
ncbi:hypothetical protein D3C81_1611900 [compost metagenome]